MNKIIKILTFVTQFGLVMLIPICLCFFIGLKLDAYFGTKFLVVIFFFIGAAAGGTGIYKLIKKENEKDPVLGTKERRERNHKGE